MSTFNPPPTNNRNNCLKCGPNETCFLYDGGLTCQPFTPPTTYPPVNNTDPSIPGGWYFANPSRYPILRYTHSLVNQTQNASCTTLPIPSNPVFADVANMILRFDLGASSQIATNIDVSFPTSLMQFRGNCAENFYCQPNAPPPNPTYIEDNTTPFVPQGSLPGTCQPNKAISSPCEASNQCRQWHIASDGSYDNDQIRCVGPGRSTTFPNGGWTGNCTSLGVGKGNIFTDSTSGSYLQRSARVYLLASLFLLCLMFVYMWYRRQKMRQQQMQYYTETGLYPGEAPASYSRRGGVNRRPDENDGELPSYGMHRRDERITGPAAEEIGMYSFSNSGPGDSPHNGTVGPNYPYPVSHPSLGNPYPPAPPDALYAPPQGSPLHSSTPVMTSQEAEAAALSAAAAAALTTPSPTASTNHQESGLLPPSYDSASAPASQPSTLATTRTNNATHTGLGTAPVTTTTTIGTESERGIDREKSGSHNPFLSSSENSPRGSYMGAEKSTFEDEQDDKDNTIPDQASASSASGSGAAKPISSNDSNKNHHHETK
ncbi:hypothetical protein FBU30_000636 [Linnemannia zychae]|nr:hypothetical protein FBU30_000636 [Linnemannia zychae]